MSAYLNVSGFEIVLPYDILDFMGCPSYISIIYSVVKHNIFLVPLKRRPKKAEIGAAKVPDKVYRRKAAFAFDMGLDFNPIMQEVSIAHSLFRNVQVDTDVMFISDFDLATIAKVPQKGLVSNVSISLDFANLRLLESVKDVGITEIYTTGGYAVGL